MNEYSASKHLEESNKNLIASLQHERDYIYSELLKSNRKDVAEKGIFKGDISQKSILNEISKLGIASLRDLMGQKVKHVATMTELKDINR